MLENIGIELKKIVDEHGRNILLDTYMVKAMLSDYAPQKTKGRMLLYTALEQGIGSYYADQLPDEPKGALIEQTAELLSPVFSEDCIEEITYAFFYALGWNADDAAPCIRRWKEQKSRIKAEEERKRKQEEVRRKNREAERRRKEADALKKKQEKEQKEEQEKERKKKEEEERKEKKYKEAYENVNDCFFANAVEIFRELGDYKDSALQLKICTKTLEELSRKNKPGIVIIILILCLAVYHIAVPLPDNGVQFFIFGIEVFVVAILAWTQLNRNVPALLASIVYPLLYIFYLFPFSAMREGMGWFDAVFNSLLLSAIIIVIVGCIGLLVGISIAKKADGRVYQEIKRKYTK